MSLTERYQRIKTKQVSQAIAQRERNEDDVEYQKDLEKFEKLLVVMTRHWGYDAEEIALIRREWTKKEVIKNAMAAWMIECDRYEIDIRHIVNDQITVGKSSNMDAKARYHIKMLGDTPRNAEDAPWMCSILEMLPEEMRGETLERYASIYTNTEDGKESERRRKANLLLIEVAESVNPEKYKVIESNARKMH